MRVAQLLLLIICFHAAHVHAAPDTLRVLFVGNSYVQVNNLPDIIAQMAADRGDVLLKTDVSMGGYTLQAHYTNANTRTQIAKKSWDFVILQEQSQMPAFPDAQVASDTYPFARALDSLVHRANPCAKTLFYMTWGRKNGDAANCSFFPPICTYNGMDSLLRARYTIMAQSNKAVLSPVGVAWHRMRNLHPTIDLYQSDESHPSEAGSYLAAATFYTILFRKNPANLTYDFTLPAPVAGNVRQVVKDQVWDSLSKWYQFRTVPPKPTSGFTQTISGRTVQFSNTSKDAVSYIWLFGDGQSDTAASTAHTYSSNGTYAVRLIANNCDGVRDTFSRQITIGATGLGATTRRDALSIYPNPAKNFLWVESAEQMTGVTLYDAAGKACRTIVGITSKRVSLDVRGLAEGVHLLRVALANGKVVTRTVGIE